MSVVALEEPFQYGCSKGGRKSFKSLFSLSIGRICSRSQSDVIVTNSPRLGSHLCRICSPFTVAGLAWRTVFLTLEIFNRQSPPASRYLCVRTSATSQEYLQSSSPIFPVVFPAKDAVDRLSGTYSFSLGKSKSNNPSTAKLYRPAGQQGPRTAPWLGYIAPVLSSFIP